MNSVQEFWRRRKITWAGGIGGMADATLFQRRNMGGLFADGADRDIFGAAAMAAFTIGVDTAVSK